MSDRRFVNVTYVQYQGKSITTRVSDEEARTLLILIDNPKSKREGLAKELGSLLDNIKVTHRQRSWHNLSVSITVEGPHGQESQPPLPARLCVFAFYALMSPNEDAVQLLKNQLFAFMSGTFKGDVIHASSLYQHRVPQLSSAPTVTIQAGAKGIIEA